MLKSIFNLMDLNKEVQASDIDFRVQSINKAGYATILAYKDARYDQKVLDEVVGPENWQKDYKIIDGNLYCGIGIFVARSENEGHWVWKWDVGTESNTEKEKGQASDAQKRAGFAWGIGRVLYDFPVISVKLNQDEFEVNSDGKSARATWRLNIRQWHWEVMYDSGSVRVRAYDTNGDLRFDSHPATKAAPKTGVGSSKPSTPAASPTSTAPTSTSTPTASTAAPMAPKADDVYQLALDYMTKNKTQLAYDAVIAKYGSSFTDAQKKTLSKLIKK